MAFRDDLYPDEYFDQLHRVTPFAAPERKWRERDRDILSLAQPSPEKTVLDLGSALGDVCFLLAPRVKEAIGVDASPQALELAEARAARPRPRERPLPARRTSRTSPAIPDASIDVAGAFDLLEHVDDDTVRRMLRALRAGPETGRRLRRLHAQPRALRREAQGARPPPEAVPGAHRGAAAARDPAAPRGGGLARALDPTTPRRRFRSFAGSSGRSGGCPLVGRLFRYRILARGGAAARRDRLTVSMRVSRHHPLPQRRAHRRRRGPVGARADRAAARGPRRRRRLDRRLRRRRARRPARASSATPRRRNAGGARNAGIDATRGDVVRVPRRRRRRAARLARARARAPSRAIPRSSASAAGSSTAGRAATASSTAS